MALWLWLLLILSVLIVLGILYRHHKESSNFPPGPPRYPIIGSLLSIPRSRIGSDIVIHFTQYAHKYGKLMGLFAGPLSRVVLVNDFELAKEMAHGDVFSGRKLVFPKLIDMRGINGRHVGIVLTQGNIWKANRRFSLSALRDFGFGKKSFGSVITEEVIAIMETFKNISGQDVLIHHNFNIPMLNILWSIVATKRFQHNDPLFTEVLTLMGVVYKYIIVDTLFPWVRYVYPEINMKPKQYFNTIKCMLNTAIDEHESNLSNNGKPKERHIYYQNLKDFIEAYLREMKVNPDLTREDLVGICMDFLEAGSETVGLTFEWIVMYLAKYPNDQDKCYIELQSVLGSDLPTLDDRPRLPYCEATIMEIERLACVTPSGQDRRAIQDTTLGGYTIPQGTYLLYNAWKFHHDPAYFPDPWSFKPERFLTADGSRSIRNEHLVPFGFGRRKCMGESLAKAQFFLFFTILVKTLKVSMPKEHKPPSEDEYESFLFRTPKPFYVHVVARE